MAVGTVSGVNPDEQWQLITSVTPSGTSVTFNSLTGYKHIWIVGKGVTKNSSDYTGIRLNNDTTSGNYGIVWGSGQTATFLVADAVSTGQGFSAKIYNIDQSIPHKLEGAYAGNQWAVSDAYVNPVAITSLVVHTYGGTATFSGGTIYVYGIAA